MAANLCLRALIVLGLALAGCADAPAEGEEHPNTAGFVRPAPPLGRLELGGPERNPDAVGARDLPVQLSRTPSAIFGVETTPGDQLFGSVTGAVVDGRGRLFILDSRARLVRTFEAAGPGATAGETVGGAGSGPGEFLNPVVLAVVPDERLLVLEVRGQLSVFDAERDSVRFSHLVRLDREVWDGCVLGEELFVHGRRAGEAETVHAYDLDGARRNSFAEVYRTGNPIVRHQISRGRVACAGNPGLILVAPTHLPELRAYTPDGDLRWWLELGGFQPIRITEVRDEGGRRGSVMRVPSEGWHTPVGLVASDRDPLALFQVASHGSTNEEAGQAEATPDVGTFLIHLDEGWARPLGHHWPPVVAWEGDRVLAVREELHPELLVFEVRSPPHRAPVEGPESPA